MQRTRSRGAQAERVLTATLAAALLSSASGCGPLLATGIYVWQGGNLVPAECAALENQRVVVVCRPPSSHEYRHAGASRSVALRVSELLVENVKKIDVVNPREVDAWVDESDWGDFRELAKAVNADKVVHVEFDDFELYKDRTLYQGQAIVSVSVYDMRDNNRLVWERHLGDVRFPINSPFPAQDKPVQQFEREFVAFVAERVAECFYPHDPNATFAIDALANR
jgi:hypothetical protein